MKRRVADRRRVSAKREKSVYAKKHRTESRDNPVAL